MSFSLDKIAKARGVCNPVVISGILSIAAVWIAYNGKAKAESVGVLPPKDSMGVQQVALGGLATTAFLYALCYYGKNGAAWFFLLAPMVLGGLEVMAILNMFEEVAMEKKSSSSQ